MKIKFNKTAREKRRERKADLPAEDRYRTVSLTSRFFLWLAVWVAALIFTQALLSTASHIFFLFVTMLLPASLIYALLSRAALKIYMMSDSAVTEKKSPYDYEFRILNESILPYPFIDAYMKLPQSNSVRCTERCVRVAMSPLSGYTVKNTVRFRFRGTYEIGVCCFYVYDFFRMFRVKVEINSFNTVYVMPRKLVLGDESVDSTADSATHTKKSPNSYEKLEVSDVREYRMGDTLKSIHWKLSSKAEELIVRDYNAGSTDVTYVFCDLSAHFPDQAPKKTSPFFGKGNEVPEKIDVSELICDEAYEDMNEYCTDGTIELAISVVMRELRAGREVCLVWFDERSDVGAFAFELHDVNDFDQIFRLFSTSAILPAKMNVARLSALVSDIQDAKQFYVIPTLDDATVTSLCSLPGTAGGVAFGSTEIIAYSAKDRFAYPREREVYIENCRDQLSQHGMKLTEWDPDDSHPSDTYAGKEGA